MDCRYERKNSGNFFCKEYGESFEINGIRITLYPAGHILGSCQVLMEFKGVKYLYTGDIKLQTDSSCENYIPVIADVLITETTFADKKFYHPSAEAEIKKLNSYNDKNIVIGAYSLGKAQRLTKLIAEHCPGKKIMIHQSMIPIHKIYEQSGFKLGLWNAYNRQSFKTGTNCVFITSPQSLSGFMRKPDFYTAFATGWKHAHRNHSISLLISDHIDWPQLHQLIENVKPSYIMTTHGDGGELKKYYSGNLFSSIRFLN